MPLKGKLKILPWASRPAALIPTKSLPYPTPPVLLVHIYHISFQVLAHTMPLPSSCCSLCIGQSSLPWVLRSALSSFESLLRLPLKWSNSCITPFHGTTAPYYHRATVSQYHEHMFTEPISLLEFYICVTLGNVYLHRVQRACLDVFALFPFSTVRQNVSTFVEQEFSKYLLKEWQNESGILD